MNKSINIRKINNGYLVTVILPYPDQSLEFSFGSLKEAIDYAESAF